MSIAVFDTYSFVKRLTAAGMPEAQAEILADEQRRLIDDRLATKDDLARMEKTSKDDLARLEIMTNKQIKESELRLEAKIEAKVEASKAEILKWMFGQTLVIIGALMAMLRFGH